MIPLFQKSLGLSFFISLFIILYPFKNYFLYYEYIFLSLILFFLLYLKFLKLEKKDLIFFTYLFLLLLFNLFTKNENFIKPFSYIIFCYLLIFLNQKYYLKNISIIYIILFLGYFLDIFYLFFDKTFIQNNFFHKNYLENFISAVEVKRIFLNFNHRFFGYFIDPLSWGIFHSIISLFLFYKKKYFFSLIIVIIGFYFTESRISIILFAVSFINLFLLRKLNYNQVILFNFFICLIMYFYSNYLINVNPSVIFDNHIRGISLIDYNINHFFGTFDYIDGPNVGTESGILYLSSIFGISFIYIILFYIKMIKVDYNYNFFRAAILISLLTLFPIHYYIFNPIILMILLFFKD